MPNTFKSFEEIQNYLNQMMFEVCAEEVQEHAENAVRRHIEDDVYGAYSPELYDRTGTLLESIVSSTEYITRNTIMVLVYHDEEKMEHYSIPWDRKLTHEEEQGLSWWIEKGGVKPLWGEGFRYLLPRPYMENAKIEVEDTVYEIIISGLRLRGLNIR